MLAEFDLAAQLREVIAREGLTRISKRSNLVHPHPALKLERLARRRFFNMWRQLGLGFCLADARVTETDLRGLMVDPESLRVTRG